jgi:hypothetical protein
MIVYYHPHPHPCLPAGRLSPAYAEAGSRRQAAKERWNNLIIRGGFSIVFEKLGFRG